MYGYIVVGDLDVVVMAGVNGYARLCDVGHALPALTIHADGGLSVSGVVASLWCV